MALEQVKSGERSTKTWEAPVGEQRVNLEAKHVPRIIWTYWHQGIDQAPEIVRVALQSMQENNPDWKIQILDKWSLDLFIDRAEFSDLEGAPLFLMADRVRLALLSQYGGVWADATVLFRENVANWLPPVPVDSFSRSLTKTRIVLSTGSWLDIKARLRWRSS